MITSMPPEIDRTGVDVITADAALALVRPYLGQCFIGGAWIAPADGAVAKRGVINPATQAVLCDVALCGPADVERAVGVARAAFDAEGAEWSRSDRLAWLQRLSAQIEARRGAFAQLISLEVGSPIDFADTHQVGRALDHLSATIDTLSGLDEEALFSPDTPHDLIRHEPLGVAALITPWNWPLNQIVLKVAGAMAAGCTMVLKPSEAAPLTAILFAECVAQAGVPQGVFNMIQGDGAGTGASLCRHAGVDVISLTGSTVTGRAVAREASGRVTRLALELGGKSANILFEDCDLEKSVRQGLAHAFRNSGQACNAASRMLVAPSIYYRVLALAAGGALNTRVGPPDMPGTHIGPLISQVQFDRVQRYIQMGLDDGAKLLAGGLGRPDGMDGGYYVRPTLFADVKPQMRIFKEEIFGPVLTLTRFEDEAEAIALANATDYGLAGYIQTADPDRALRVARGLRVGMVQVNGTSRAPGTPFGGRKQSGYGRESGLAGILSFQDVKSLSGIGI